MAILETHTWAPNYCLHISASCSLSEQMVLEDRLKTIIIDHMAIVLWYCTISIRNRYSVNTADHMINFFTSNATYSLNFFVDYFTCILIRCDPCGPNSFTLLFGSQFFDMNPLLKAACLPF